MASTLKTDKNTNVNHSGKKHAHSMNKTGSHPD